MNADWINAIKWNAEGLVPVIAQEDSSGQVLMLAWMNEAALRATVATGEAVYWSRSRQKLWHKGETSGHSQRVKSLALDCDGDTLLLRVEQRGGIACHTGRPHCFFRRLESDRWQVVDAVKKDPRQIYGDDVQ